MPFISLTQAVGKNCPNQPHDVRTVHARLIDIGKVPRMLPATVFGEGLLAGIKGIQRHFMQAPDGVISMGGQTQAFMAAWSEKQVSPGVQLPGRLREAWDLVNPLLPEGSYCSSGFRTAASQRAILHKFYNTTYKTQIIAKYGQPKYDSIGADLVVNEGEVLAMVRGVGQAIAKPGSSKHQKGLAVDIGGPAHIDNKQVEIVKLVARARSELFSGVVLKERNGCVHFEIR